MIEMVNIFIYKNKAYLPVLGKTEVGYFYDTDRLFVTDLTIEAITSSLEEIIKMGNPPMKHPTQAEFRKSLPIQKALKIYSYKKMAQAGVICCVIYWAKDYIGLAFSAHDTKDVQVIDYAHQKKFTPDTELREIVEAIFTEVNSRNVVG